MNKVITLIADGNAEIRDFLRRRFSYAQIKNLRREGVILCNGNRVNAKYRLKKGDELTLQFFEEKRTEYTAKNLDIRIVYEDEDYLIVDKGSGISCIPNQHGLDNLFEGLVSSYPDDTFHVLTRLDKDTSGLVVLARSSLAASAAIRMRKFYLALVEGELSCETRIDAPIARADDIRRVVREDGKPSVTLVRPLSYGNGQTLVECELLTGRTHQIRVHLAYIGHPIVGDTLYGNAAGAYNSGQKLLCYRLETENPFTQEKISVRSERTL